VANFIFNWAAAALQAATLDLSTGNYYAHLVTVAPALGHSTVADLVLPTSGSYTSTPLTGLSYNTARWTFDSFNFPRYSFVTAPTGVVICQRNGTSPANTDGIICYSDFSNSIGQQINLQVGVYVVNLQFGSNGAINFSYRYQYGSGAYSSVEPVPKGLIFLIGSKNNTLAYTNPFNNTNCNSNGNDPFVAVQCTNRTLVNTSFKSFISYDFGNLRILPNVFGFYSSAAVAADVQLSGSNDASISDSGVAVNANWTLLGSKSSTLANVWSFINVTNPTYWRYFKLQTANNSQTLGPIEIEFYSSLVLSPTANFV
jgi:hypothetical protein